MRVSTSDITTMEGCAKLLDVSEEMGPVGGIFNLAVALRDGIFVNQTKDMFKESFGPKPMATMFLDKLSRRRCTQLKHFVVFSSVSCGRGNAGQTNYGMANSIMERIIESRVESGYPGKAIQWGAVGEVGLVADMAEDKIDMEIGGTLQQRISSCLQELDNLLLAPDAVVSSMVVAEKRAGRSGNESITETVMNIMGIRDLKSVSLGTTLSEMGMDSLMAVEIKQALERDFELVLTPQDLRSLTFQKLQEYAEARESTDDVKMIFSSDSKQQGMDLLLRNLGDESDCTEILLPLHTSADATKLQTNPTIIIPGVEGTAGQAWYKVGNSIDSKAIVLQIYSFAELTSVKDIAESAFEHIKSVLKTSEPFYIIGYSFGSYITLHLAGLLEKAGFRGKVLLIDGAPHFLTKLTRLHLGKKLSELDLYDELLAGIVNQFLPEETKELLGIKFNSLPTLEEKIKTFMGFVEKQNVYSKEYSRTMVHAIHRRIYMAAHYDLENIEEIKSPIALIRPAEVSLQDVEDDYCLTKITSGKVTVKVIEGNHSTMLDNPALIQLINDFHPCLEEDKNFEQYIRDSKPSRVV